MPNFNAFMHRRNIFRKEPDFKKLASEYTELRQFMTTGFNKKLKFDFKNPDALRAFTVALLHRYFQKTITLPPDRLIPAVPQRLNYICWIEDLVRLVENQESDLNILGFDIGTGASCILPILACHRNPTWSFMGVEADEKSHTIALENVRRNFMEDRIRLVKITTEDTLNDIISFANTQVTFIICNPPFFEEEYGVTLELNPNNCSSSVGAGSHGCRPKSSSNTSDKIESVVGGGEIAFVGHMLEQSRYLKEDVTIYSSMLGKKQSLTHFKQTLSSLNERHLSWTWAELCQGKTIRYAIAWTFKPGLDLKKAPPLRHGKNKSWKVKLFRKMPKRDCQLELMENAEYLKNLIGRELMIAKAKITRQTSQTFEMLIKTNDKTWTSQRRKRREQLNKHKHQATNLSMHFATGSSAGHTTTPVSPPMHGDKSNDMSVEVKDETMSTSGDCVPSKDVARLSLGENFAANADLYSQEIMASLKNFVKSSSGQHVHSSKSRASMANNRCNSGITTTATTTTGNECDNAYGKPHCSNHEQNSEEQNDFEDYDDECLTINSASNSNSTRNITSHGSRHQQQQQHQRIAGVHSDPMRASSRKRKNPSTCSSSPSRACPSPNDENTDDDNQSTDTSSSSVMLKRNVDQPLDDYRASQGHHPHHNHDDGEDDDEDDEDSELDRGQELSADLLEIKRIRIKDHDEHDDHADDAYNYLLCCRLSLTRVCHDIYFELKLEHPCRAANEAYDLFQYFRNKLNDK